MSKNLTPLQAQLAAHEVFGQFRYIVIDGEIYFVGTDIAKILGYSNTRDALAKHVDDEDKNTVAIHDGILGNPNKVIINESGLYSLIFNSKLPQAKKFKRWVTSEVLPSIRKTSSYSVAPKRKSIAEILLESYKENNIELTEITLPDGRIGLMAIRDIENFKKLQQQDPTIKMQFAKIVNCRVKLNLSRCFL